MQQAQEVVIIDDQGREHVFPAGFDPKRAAEIVRAQKASAPQDSPYGEVFPDYAAAGSKMAGEVGSAVKNNPGTVGALAAGVALAPFTGGMSVPGVMAAEAAAAGAGHLAGEGLSATLTDRPVPQDLAQNVALETTFGGLTAGVGPALQAIGRGLYHTALKPTLSMTRTPDEIAKLIDTGVKEGITVSKGGYRKAQGLIDAIDADVTKLISDLNTVEDPRKGFEKIAALRQRYLKRGAPQSKVDALDALEANYRQRYSTPMRGEEMHELKKGIWQETGPSFERELNTGTTDAMREFGSGLRETIEDAGKRRGIEDIGTKNARMGDLIELREQIERSAAHYPGIPATRQAVEYMTGSSAPGLVSRAVATSAPVLSGVGRRMARVGEVLDPRALRPTSAHPPIGGKPKQTPASLDQLGIPENAGPAYAPDQLDSLGIPAGTPGRSEEELWMQRVAPEPVITHRPPTRSPLDRGTSYAKKTELDELGIPAAEGPVETRVGLDALDIPSSKEMYTPEQLWARKLLLKEFPEIANLPPREQERRLLELVKSGAYKASVERNPNARITKDRIQDLYRRYLSSKP